MRGVRWFVGVWFACIVACSSTSSGTTTTDAGPEASAGNDSGSGSDAGGDAPAAPGPASITITSPAEGASLSFDGEPTVPVAFTVTGFTLGDISSCAASPACGDVWINVDGADCNAPTGGAPPRNEEGSVSPVIARLEYCFKGADGAHTIIASLHDKNGNAYKDSTGKEVVSAPIHITGTTVGNDGGTD